MNFHPSKKRCAAALVFVFSTGAHASSFFPGTPFSDKAAGSTAASFLKVPAGARAEALGEACVASVQGAEAAFWNTAGLARLDESGRSDLSFSYNLLLEGSQASAVSYARPVQNIGVVGASLLYFSAGSIQGYDALQNKTGSFTPNDLAVLFSYARRMESLSVGGGFKWVRSSVSDVSAMTLAGDFGVQARHVTEFGEGPVDMGLSVQNLGPPMKIGGASDPLPFKFQPGVLWYFSPTVRASLDGHLPVDHDPYPSFGLEGFLFMKESKSAVLRAGYNVANSQGVDALAGMSMGFGLELARLRLDYAWVPRGDLGTTHRISFGLTF